MRSRKEGFGPEVIRRIMIGTHVLSSGHYDAYYTKAQKVRTVIKNDYEAVFARADVLLTPTTPDLPFKFGQYDDNPTAMYLADYYTIPVNMAGIAGMSVPTSLIEGLPASVQIVANHGREVDLFRAGAALEAASAFPYADVPVASSGLV
jgi:aspartyl-tRNA(Asn)/glutamyl-tRNA(Gln) amidotransferase subunit A